MFGCNGKVKIDILRFPCYDAEKQGGLLMSGCGNCSGNCGGCSGCAGCGGAMELSRGEVDMLLTLGQIPFLPVARKMGEDVPVYLEDDITLVGNEESKLIGMPGNRRLDSGSIIAGPFYLVGDTGDDFRSLTDEETQSMMKRFEHPEDISPEEVEADTGFCFISF
jgi:hypothetical protein